MPNHVRTVVKFKNLKSEEDFEYLLNTIGRKLKIEDDMFTVDHDDWVIDFNKIIPEPTSIEDCPAQDIIKDEHKCGISVDPRKPWFNWYSWRLTNWNTKWGAYDGYTERSSNSLTFVFSTAWSFAEPVIKRLTLLNYNMEVYYADESWGTNCGKVTYSVRTKTWTHLIGDEASKNPYQFAKRIWDKY